MMKLIMIHDLKGSDGKTYKESNLEKQHAIDLGSLVEVLHTGVRLFVVNHTRDCDGTPLYWLCADRDDVKQHRQGFRNSSWVGGYSEEGIVKVA